MITFIGMAVLLGTSMSTTYIKSHELHKHNCEMIIPFGSPAFHSCVVLIKNGKVNTMVPLD